MRLFRAAFLLYFGFTSASAAELCPQWSQGATLGVLDERLVPEASGLAVSSDGTRLYHVNDSGGGPFLYTSALDGSDLRRLRLEGDVSSLDTEALALAHIGGEPVLIVADIGDNALRRRFVDLLAVPEAELSTDRAQVRTRLRVRYPDGPHNAEALAAAPNGDLFLFTKSWGQSSREPAPSRIYRLPASAWANASPEPITLQPAGEIDFPALATRERAPLSDVVTDASMARDGSRFLVLTYGYAWELALDLGAGPPPPTAALERGRDYQLVRLPVILGKETIAYLPGDRAFLFGKEFQADSKPSQLIRLDCTSEQ
ncbi:MAG: hypothetical protein H6509_05510 [Bryobacterales bacterium]|nr:hypothetical protein [Acidobacteriota bacterium]MCB9384050.1 hypothetical protein [Bryobacterales bacterium]